MSLIDNLKEEIDGINILIPQYLEKLAMPSRKGFEFILSGLWDNYRIKAVGSYLLDGDIVAYCEYLRRSARCQLLYFNLIQMGESYSASVASLTNDMPFFAALAGQFGRDVYLLSYYQSKFPSDEDYLSPRFPYGMFIRAKGDSAFNLRYCYKEAKVENWLATSQKENKYWRICNSFQLADGLAFENAIDYFVAETIREQEKNEDRICDRLISIEALGLCWVARKLFKLDFNYENSIVPLELQFDLPRVILPNDTPMISQKELEQLDLTIAQRHNTTVDKIQEFRPDPQK